MSKAPLKNRLDQLTLMEKLALGQIGRTKIRRHDWKPSPQMMRLREIEKVIRSRHGSTVPNPRDTDDRDFCLAYIIAAALSKVEGQCMKSWCSKWAPWASAAEVVEAEIHATKRNRMITADGVAGMLLITWEERSSIGLKTIGACDISKLQRNKLAKERKRLKDRERQEQLRRRRGSKDRNSHAALTLTYLKPWEGEGISRATWYRRQRETEQSRVDIYTNGDTLVSSVNGDALHANNSNISKPLSVAASERDAGLGEHPPAEIHEAEPHGNDDDCGAISVARRNAA